MVLHQTGEENIENQQQKFGEGIKTLRLFNNHIGEIEEIEQSEEEEDEQRVQN